MASLMLDTHAVIWYLLDDGNLSEKIHWGHVGDLSHLNSIFEEALQVKLVRVK